MKLNLELYDKIMNNKYKDYSKEKLRSYYFMTKSLIKEMKNYGLKYPFDQIPKSEYEQIYGVNYMDPHRFPLSLINVADSLLYDIKDMYDNIKQEDWVYVNYAIIDIWSGSEDLEKLDTEKYPMKIRNDYHDLNKFLCIIFAITNRFLLKG